MIEKCDTKKYEWMCKTCDKTMQKSKMLIQDHSNDLGHCPVLDIY